MAERLDLVIFGATGFTGQFCMEAALKLSKSRGRNLTWGIAGRSESKLKEVISKWEIKIGQKFANKISIIVADVNDHDSLVKMTGQARVVINCTGPYRFFGEPVIKACIETGTHQVDVTGEPEYMERIQLNYHKAAQEKGIYIVSACGFDSIPADMGVLYLQKHFEGTLNSVETYLMMGSYDNSLSGSSINYATWESAVHGLANAAELGAIRRKLYTSRLPSFTPKQLPRPSIHKCDLLNKAWSVPFMGSDRSVVQRSQRFFYEQKRYRPIQVQTYWAMPSTFYLGLMIIFGWIFQKLVKYEFGRSLLLKYPSLFSAGTVTVENPPIDKVESANFSLTLSALGWKEKLADVSDQYETPPDSEILGRVEGKSPGYGLTSKAVTLSAIKILTEKEKLPGGGGVYPPAAAFADTSLIDELQENGITFKLESVKNISN